MLLASFRSSRSEVFFEKGVFKNFAKFTGKYLCQSLFVNKISGLRPATLLKKKLWHKGFPVSFMKFLRTSFFIEHLLVGAYLFLQCMQYQNDSINSFSHTGILDNNYYFHILDNNIPNINKQTEQIRTDRYDRLR